MRWWIPVLLLSCTVVARAADPMPVRSLAFSPDSKTLAVGTGMGERGELTLLDVETFAPVWRQAQEGRVRDQCWLPGSKAIAVGAGRSLVLIDAATGRASKTLGKHEKGIQSLALSPDGKTLASGSEDRTIKVWDVAKQEESKSLRHPGNVRTLTFSPDGKTLLSATGEEARITDVATGKVTQTFAAPGRFRRIACAMFLPDGKEVLTGDNSGNAQIWDVAHAGQHASFSGVGGVDFLGYEPTSRRLLLASVFKLVGLIDYDTRKPDAAVTRRIDALLKQLDDDDYDTREKAEEELAKIGFVAEPHVRKARESKSARGAHPGAAGT